MTNVAPATLVSLPVLPTLPNGGDTAILLLMPPGIVAPSGRPRTGGDGETRNSSCVDGVI